MGDSQLSAVTAIHGAEYESFVASTLYGQGWSVSHRALDWDSVIEFLEASGSLPEVLLCSTDLRGIDREKLKELAKQGVRIFLFRKAEDSANEFPSSIPQPSTALELIGLVRGSIRSPLVRDSVVGSLKVRAKVVGIASAHSSAGCTTLAINVAAELSISGSRTLLIDAHASSPSIAILLGEQGIQSARGFQQLASGFWGIEVTQENLSESLTLFDNALYEFDFIIIDLGPIYQLAQVLSGRRWGGETMVWTASHADELWVLSKSDRIGIERLKKLVQDLNRNSMKPSITFIQSFTKTSRRPSSGDEAFLSAVTPLKPKALLRYPLDSRSAAAAQNSQETLFQSNEKSFLRKSIQGLSGKIGT